MSDDPRTFDLRLWVTADPPAPALAAFFADVVDLAQRHPGIEPRWTCERRARGGGPRIARVHQPPRFGTGHNDAADEAAGRSTT